MEPLQFHATQIIHPHLADDPEYDVYVRDKMTIEAGRRLIQALSNKPPSKVVVRWETTEQEFMGEAEKQVRLSIRIDRSGWDGD